MLAAGAAGATWPPGTAQGESALFHGHLLGRVVRRRRPHPRPVPAREVCAPHGLDFHVGLTDAELGRVADLTGFAEDFLESQRVYPDLYHRDQGTRRSTGRRRRQRRAVATLGGVPAVNGHGTARGVAGLYAALAQGGRSALR